MDMRPGRRRCRRCSDESHQAAENAGGEWPLTRAGDLLPELSQKRVHPMQTLYGRVPPSARLNEDEKRFIQCSTWSRCCRCGTCMGACPVRVISFENYSIRIPWASRSERGGAGRVRRSRASWCWRENDAYPALDQAGMNGVEINSLGAGYSGALPSSVSLSWVTDSLNSATTAFQLPAAQRATTTSVTLYAAPPWRNERDE